MSAKKCFGFVLGDESITYRTNTRSGGGQLTEFLSQAVEGGLL